MKSSCSISFPAPLWLALLLLCCLCGYTASAQNRPESWSNWRSKMIATSPETQRLDSLSLVPGSVVVSGVDTNDYLLDPFNAQLHWLRKPRTDSVRIRYRVLPLSFFKKYAHKDRKLIDSQLSFGFTPINAQGGGQSFVDFPPLQYNGSYGRSLSFGNSQDAALQSQFNFQASGYLPDSIRVEAAISDNTLPIQPDGNTQRLQEFDQVYIRLSKRQQLLQLGDYNLAQPKSYFLGFDKRVQGLYYQNGFRTGRGSNAFGLSASLAKGEFARNIFNGTEGNQGPYKLTGNNGEQFFIVLAGTEKVFINGLVMERGENADYTINYNTGEISFMPRRLITKDSRIQVEFEYQNRSYLNSLVYAWDEWKPAKNWKVQLNVYSNQDAKNQGYTQNLNADQKSFLATIGDSIGNAFYPSYALDTFAAGKVLYKLIDTTVAGQYYDSVFIYSTNPDSARYRLSFSYVGPGHGDYVISAKVANGRVYDWLPRNNGAPQGDYAPVQLLVTPKMQQVFTLGSEWQIDSFQKLSIEVASSNFDPNLFSTKDNQSHLGFATHLHYQGARFLGAKDSSGSRPWEWQNEAGIEWVQDRFKAIAPYRNVEFGRDWNVPMNDAQKPDEQLLDYSTSLARKELGKLAYSFGYYGRGKLFKGYRNVLAYDLNRTRWRTNINLNLTQTDDTALRTKFFRPSLQAEYRLQSLGHTALGLQWRQEDNQIRNTQSDSLTTAAFRNTISTAYLRTPENQLLHYNLSYSLRSDEHARNNHFFQSSHSNTLDFNLTYGGSRSNTLKLTGSYRQLIVDDTLFSNQRSEETGLGRVEYSGTLLKGAIQCQTLYETGAGQEQKRSYTYVEVPAGQGIYTWVDYNHDGVQQPNEFEIALYPDQKKFIRVLTPTNEYVRVNYVNFNQSLSLDPSLLFKAGSTRQWQKFVSRFYNQGSLQISNRLTGVNTAQAINPFIASLRDDRILIASSSLSNTVFFNRSSTHWGLDYTYQQNSSKQLLTYGVEGQGNLQHSLRLRWNFRPSFTARLTGQEGLRSYESALADGRSYEVNSYAAEPSLSWLHRAILRVTGSYRYDQRNNEQEYGGEASLIQRLNLEARYSKPVTGVLQISFSYADIRYDGLAQAPVSYSMLDALQPGANYIWNLSWERRVGKGIEISLEYDGRKSGDDAAVHTGRMSIRALL
ncbi:MAG: hypothetical protein JST27_09280 [Bacteroidetes bacterium]|nr:hypothetical protein [Bacteroidota bacterium]